MANRTYQAKLGYQLQPLLELGIEPEQEKGTLRALRRDERVELEREELVLDGEDELALVARLRRADQPEGTAVEDVTVERWRAEVIGNAKDSLAVELDQYHVEAGSQRFFLRSTKPHLYQQPTDFTLTLKVTAVVTLRSTVSAGGSVKHDVEGSIELRPCPIYLQLWVVPSLERGFSTALAYCGVAFGRAPWLSPLRRAPLELSTESLASSPTLEIADADVKSSLADGSQLWKLRYVGMSWNTIAFARFKVKCRLEGDADAVYFVVDVSENGQKVLADLLNATGLDLTNAEWNRQYSLAWDVDFAIPAECRGAVYNFRNRVASAYNAACGSGEPVRDEWQRYCCSNMSYRIFTWLIERRAGRGRFAPRDALGMNGIEIAEYVAGHVHAWAGIHLSGQRVVDDPRFIDPWFEQENNERAYGGTWTTVSVKMAAVVSYLLASSVALAAVLYPVVSKGAAMGARKILSWSEFLTMASTALSGLLGGVEVPSAVYAAGAVAVAVAGMPDLTLGANPRRYEWSDDFSRYLPSSSRTDAHLHADLLKPLRAANGLLAPVEPWQKWDTRW